VEKQEMVTHSIDFGDLSQYGNVIVTSLKHYYRVLMTNPSAKLIAPLVRFETKESVGLYFVGILRDTANRSHCPMQGLRTQ